MSRKPGTPRGPHTVYYQVGPRKGQPKLCALCPNPVVPNSLRLRRCADHLQAGRRQRNRKSNRSRRQRDKHQRRQRILNPPLRLTLAQLPHRAEQGGPDYHYFSHLPLEQQQIANAVLERLIAKHGCTPSWRLAQLIACATTVSKCGGPLAWSAYLRHCKLSKRHITANIRRELLTGIDPS